jgi:hypothetical protein
MPGYFFEGFLGLHAHVEKADFVYTLSISRSDEALLRELVA